MVEQEQGNDDKRFADMSCIQKLIPDLQEFLARKMAEQLSSDLSVSLSKFDQEERAIAAAEDKLKKELEKIKEKREILKKRRNVLRQNFETRKKARIDSVKQLLERRLMPSVVNAEVEVVPSVTEALPHSDNQQSQDTDNHAPHAMDDDCGGLRNPYPYISGQEFGKKTDL